MIVAGFFVEVMKESDFDLDKVFENELLFLLPFYSFNYKNEFEDIEKDGKFSIAGT